MELSKLSIILLLVGILVIGVVSAVMSHVYVDVEHSEHQISNVSNLTISERFYDGTLYIEGGNIGNATEINSTRFYQNGNPVMDSTGNATLWDLVVKLDNATNISQTEYTDAQDLAANTSLRNFVDKEYYNKTESDAINDTMRDYVSREYYNKTESDAINDTMRDYVSREYYNKTESDAINDTMTSHVHDTFINKSSEGDLNVNSSDNWDSLDTPLDFTTAGTYGTTDYQGQLVNATEMWEDGHEVATLDDLVTGNVTVTSIIFVKNVGGATANKGAAMMFSAYNAGVDRFDVIFANNTASEYHAHCLMLGSTANNANGQCVVSGVIETMDTDHWAEGSDLYLNNTPGTLTQYKPLTAPCIQKVALVTRSHATIGSLYVHGAARCNDIGSSFNISGSGNTSTGFWQEGYKVLDTRDNTSMWDSVVALDISTNTSLLSYITGLIANYFTKTESSEHLANNISNVNISQTAYTDARDSEVNLSVKNWSLLYGYPSACPANTYITQLDDSTTCTGISDIYALNNGDNLTGNYSFTTGNIGLGTTDQERQLVLNGGAASAYFQLTKDSTGAGADNGLEIGVTGTGDTYFFNREEAFTYFYTNGSGRLIILAGGNVGIGTAAPSYPLEVSGEVSDISIYASANVSAAGFLTRTSNYDKSRGKALKLIKDADDYKTNGEIDHKKFYGYAGSFEVTDYSRPETEYYGGTNSTGPLSRTVYPHTKQEEAVSIDKEIDVLRQAVYELKTELCLYEEYGWCG